MDCILVSMFTPGTPYETEIGNLRKSVERYGYEYKFYPIKNTGDWTENCAKNSEVILKAMEDFPDRDIMFVDADATVERDIDLIFPHDFGINLVQYPGEKFPRYNTGTIFAANIPDVRRMMEKWMDLNTVNRIDSEYGEAWEQSNLRTVLSSPECKRLRWASLPDSYCWIFDNPIQRSRKREEPVIVHHQASRRFKSLINGVK